MLFFLCNLIVENQSIFFKNVAMNIGRDQQLPATKEISAYYYFARIFASKSFATSCRSIKVRKEIESLQIIGLHVESPMSESLAV